MIFTACKLLIILYCLLPASDLLLGRYYSQQCLGSAFPVINFYSTRHLGPFTRKLLTSVHWHIRIFHKMLWTDDILPRAYRDSHGYIDLILYCSSTVLPSLYKDRCTMQASCARTPLTSIRGSRKEDTELTQRVHGVRTLNSGHLRALRYYSWSFQHLKLQEGQHKTCMKHWKVMLELA